MLKHRIIINTYEDGVGWGWCWRSTHS